MSKNLRTAILELWKRRGRFINGRQIMNISRLVEQHRDEILRIATRRGAHNIRIFGSVARDAEGDHNDLDLIVDLEPGRNLLDLGGFLMEVQELLGVNMDVVTVNGLRERIRERALEEAIPL